MKKSICGFFALMIFALFTSCGGAIAVDNSASDDVKIETAQDKPLSKRKIKKQKRKELKERQKAQRQELKQAQKQEKTDFKLAQKKEKLDSKIAKKQKKQELKQAKKQKKADLKLAKKQNKQDLKQAKKQAKENFKQAKENLKQEKIKQKEDLKQAKIAAKQEALQMEIVEEKNREARKIQKKDVEDIFGETTLISYGDDKKSDKKSKEIEAVETARPAKTEAKPNPKKTTEASNTKSSDRFINLKEAEKELEESVNQPNETVDEQEDEDVIETSYNKKERKKRPSVYKKTYTYADIDKNAVSINDFLQFTEEQNEKFSVFYYKTTTKLNSYNKSIKTKEAERRTLEADDISVEDKLTKIKKLKRETDDLYYERDRFYNDSLDKFNSILNKKQRTKWEILQEMGYRFLPEID